VVKQAAAAAAAWMVQVTIVHCWLVAQVIVKRGHVPACMQPLQALAALLLAMISSITCG
jgi:hypothetical protein